MKNLKNTIKKYNLWKRFGNGKFSEFIVDKKVFRVKIEEDLGFNGIRIKVLNNFSNNNNNNILLFDILNTRSTVKRKTIKVREFRNGNMTVYKLTKIKPILIYFNGKSRFLINYSKKRTLIKYKVRNLLRTILGCIFSSFRVKYYDLPSDKISSKRSNYYPSTIYCSSTIIAKSAYGTRSYAEGYNTTAEGYNSKKLF